MKYYYPTGLTEEVRLGEGELISAGEEILSRARVLGEALMRKVENTVHLNGCGAGATCAAGAAQGSPRQPRDD